MGNSSSSSSFPYTIEELQHNSSTAFPYSIHTGLRKSDCSPVTVFKLSKQTINHPYILQAATQHYTKSKTLIHPHVLRTYGTLDTDEGTTNNMGELIIVTEEVVPLRVYLEEMNQEEPDNVYNAIAWGLYCLIHALHFLHDTAKVSHGLVTLDSIYVTKGGDWKLGNFGLLTSIEARGVSFHFRECEEIICPNQYRSAERKERRWDVITAPNIVDSYSLGVVMEEIYNMVGNHATPEILVKAIARLKTNHAKARPRVFPLLKCPLFANNPLVNSLKILEEYAAKPTEEKISFLQSLPESLTRGSFYTKHIAQYKLLPELLQSLNMLLQDGSSSMSQDIVRREVMAILPLLFLIIEKTPPEENWFKINMTPVLLLLFTVNDRGVRGALLSRMNLFVRYFDKSTINANIFEPMCSGFTDSSGALRELTLKSTLPLVEHLNPTSLEKLTRYLIRLQGDAEPSIRTNTVIFIGKILPSLGKDARDKIFFSSFGRGVKDEFTPCKNASIKMLIQCKEYMSVDDVANKLLPMLIPFLLYKDASVRKSTMEATDVFMTIVKDECQKRNANQVESEADTPANSTLTAQKNASSVESAPASGSSSYFTGFSSYFGSTSTTETVHSGEIKASASLNSHQNNSAPTNTQSSTYGSYGTNASTNSYNATNSYSNSYNGSSSYNQSSTSNFNDDAEPNSWGEDDDDLLGLDTPSTSNTTNSLLMPQTSYNQSSYNDPFASIPSYNTSNIPKPPSSRGKLVIPKKDGNKITTSSLKDRKAEYERRKAERLQQQQQQSKKIDDGWDDF